MWIYFGREAIMSLDFGKDVAILVEESAWEGVARVAEKMAADIGRVTGRKPHFVTAREWEEGGWKQLIWCVTLQKSGLLEAWEKKYRFESGKIKGKREVYQIQSLVDEDGEKEILMILGSDKRGTIYGMFHLSEYIGVSPLCYWGDAEPERKPGLVLDAGVEGISKEPSVRYRGFFINDEWPCFGNWTTEHFGGFNERMYDHVFELLLRLKGNYLWPAMWTSSFPLDGPGSRNEELADIYGVVVGNSHHEPCLRASEEWDKVRGPKSPYGNEWNFYTNKDGLLRYWKDGLERSGRYEKIITIGMRGERDSAILGDSGIEENIRLLKDIITKQKALIRETVKGNPPLLFALYKEVEPYYYGDETTPGLKDWDGLDDVICMLCEDNFGHMRSLPDPICAGKGRYGMYYHFDYHGEPVSYEWVDSTPLSQVWEQMCEAYEYGVRDVWIVNVGDLKFHEVPLTYFLELAYDYDKWGIRNTDSWKEYMTLWAQKTFPEATLALKKKIVDVYAQYVHLNYLRRPEANHPGVYHPCNYEETDRMLSGIEQLEAHSGEVLNALPETEQDAYYSMIHHSAMAAANLLKIHLYAGKNAHYAKQGKPVANQFRDLCLECLRKDREMAETFAAFRNGKWKGMELARHIGFTKWNDDDCRYPILHTVLPFDKPRLKVSRKDEEAVAVRNYGSPDRILVEDFCFAGIDRVTLEVANDGEGELIFSIRTKDGGALPRWLTVMPMEGNVSVQQEVELHCDRDALPKELERVELLIGDGVTDVAVEISAKKVPVLGLPEYTFFARDGLITIDAAHYCGCRDAEDCGWRTLWDYGKYGSGVKVFPITATFSLDEKKPEISYRFLIEKAGEYTVELVTEPTNPAVYGEGLSVSIKTGNGRETRLCLVSEDYRAGDSSDKRWSEGVLNQERRTRAVLFFEKGLQELSIGALEAGVVLERLYIYPEGKGPKPSYLGPQESYGHFPGDGPISVLPFYDGWFFLKTGLEAGLEDVRKRKDSFVRVELPHDWLIYQTQDLYEDSCGWYRKEFEAHGSSVRMILRFDGVYMDSTVYCNGVKIGDWKYGYSAFDMDLTIALKEGKNEVLIQVRHQSPNSRWYSGAGLYRKVWIKLCAETYLPMDGTYVSTAPCENGFRLEAETEIAGRKSGTCACRYLLRAEDGTELELGWQQWKKEDEAGKGVCKVGISAVVPNPSLWDVEEPICYTLVVELWEKQARLARKDRPCLVLIDRSEITVGFRTMCFNADEGFFLNGRHLKIHGVCEHHDFGCLGATFHTAAMERKIRILKQMGVNAIRTSHNMPAAELMELADSMGMLVVNESFDMWERSKTAYDYSRFFREWAPKDIRSQVRRDRNHPSLMLWSIGNEIYDTHADERGQEITRRLVSYVRAYDPKENAQITIGSNYMPWENARKCADIIKVVGYNYGEKYYAAHHAAYPDWIMYGSETGSLVSSRGIYHFPLSQSVLAEEDEQCSSLGNSSTSWGARSLEDCVIHDRDADYIFGQFLWSGFDYIGEPTPYHTKNSYFGQIDTAGFPKDAYYFFQAAWTDWKKAPMLHLLPYWCFNQGQMIDVRAYTNAPLVELFVNGRSLGRQELDHAHGKKLAGDWRVAYEPGTITAVAYDADGKEILRESRTSFGDSKSIVLEADRDILRADCEDLCFVTVSTMDENGNPVENAVDYVWARIEGPGRILGMDNGDSTDYEPYKADMRKLFSGKLLIVIGTTSEPGTIRLTVSGRRLASASLELTSKPSGKVFKEALEDCAGYFEQKGWPDVVPVRMVELRCIGKSARLTPQEPLCQVEASIRPAEVLDARLIWQVVNAGGVEVGFADVAETECADGKHIARVCARGDGAFLLRAMVQTEGKVRVISQLEFEAEGFGCAFLDPYRFLSAGLYTETVGEITNGNEKGIATARDGESGVIYSDIDFGENGSDRLTLSIFALSGEAYPIEIWKGKPHSEQGRLLTTVIYQKPSVWNVYQEETYTLPERLRGVVTLSFMMKAKVHMKGFVFEKQSRAFARLWACEADAIYGDHFVRQGRRLCGIGNNVTLQYDGMDFREEGAHRIRICGKTELECNTIHIHFTPEGGETVNDIVEFTRGKEYVDRIFSISPLYGCGKVEIIFLPGSSFDLESFQFLPL